MPGRVRSRRRGALRWPARGPAGMAGAPPGPGRRRLEGQKREKRGRGSGQLALGGRVPSPPADPLHGVVLASTGLFGFTLPPELWKPLEWNVTGSPVEASEDPHPTAEGTLGPGKSITGGGGCHARGKEVLQPHSGTPGWEREPEMAVRLVSSLNVSLDWDGGAAKGPLGHPPRARPPPGVPQGSPGNFPWSGNQALDVFLSLDLQAGFPRKVV